MRIDYYYVKFLSSAMLPVSVWVLLLLIKSIKDFSRTGPQLKEEVLRHYRWYSVYALMRLGVAAFVVSLFFSICGLLLYYSLAVIFDAGYSAPIATLFAALGIGLITGIQFCRHLLFYPGSLEASASLRVSRFYPLWYVLNPTRVCWIQLGSVILLLIPVGMAIVLKTVSGSWLDAVGLFGGGALYSTLAFLAWYKPAHAEPRTTDKPAAVQPNIVMIGSDTLRGDRLGVEGCLRPLTPFIDSLAEQGVYFRQCYVPCARTAPSVVSLISGTWPFKHGVRDNFAAPDEMETDIPFLPEILCRAGYETVVVSDWAGADFGKFNLGFRQKDLPEDQWNIKYLIRQGPKDIRLFLSLFTHGWFGKTFLPELYYLAGVPMTAELGQAACTEISRLADAGIPFLLNIFMSTTHGPFGSEYPYYTLYSKPGYRGSCKFVMGGLTDPFEIVQRQKEGQECFDLEQIIDLYDGCVRNFDNEVARIVQHLDRCGLRDNTIVVLYSDHGLELFERDIWGQGNSVIVDSSARIPLLIVDPRQRAHQRLVKDVVRSIDLAPTLLELCGIPAPTDMDGRSLRPYLESDQAALDLVAYSETGIWFSRLRGMSENHLLYPELPDLLEVQNKKTGSITVKKEYREQIIKAKDRMIRTKHWKLVCLPMQNGLEFQLFNIESDPDCHNNVIDVYPDVAADLKSRFGDFFLH